MYNLHICTYIQTHSNILQKLNHTLCIAFSNLLISHNIMFEHVLYFGYLCISVFITLVDSV